MPDLTLAQWLLAVLGAAGLGVGKAGLSGMSLVHVLIFAFLFGARDSTGIVLPMLLVGDVCAVTAYHQHARWDYIRRMLPPACMGVVAGSLLMLGLDDAAFKPTIGWIILVLSVLQAARMQRPEWFGSVPHTRGFAWSIGLAAGATTMLANAAGPVFALYCLAVMMPKYELVGTTAWFFFIINLFKVPFSYGLGLIHGQTLLFNLALVPAVVAGVLGGRSIVALLLAFAAVAALRMIFS